MQTPAQFDAAAQAAARRRANTYSFRCRLSEATRTAIAAKGTAETRYTANAL